MRRGVYRPASVGRFRARIGDDGLPVAVDMRVAAQNMMASLIMKQHTFLQRRERIDILNV
jgi:isoquinoline 1-oxidoreductase beta subunit